ncbi:hypothetical protein GCM10010156_61690 [Planobispora rosea]|uniref:Uncharacterized protein n=1 Tax=Planobispora rosea TaxID=35762 RepID=A0A8J3WFJ1_PLARO|nr:hypothetical protein GCM10010156_61690 [Planobispora rosea]GIH87470.1 hypothetical protein Pro02_58780 [Planobispora rosea]
MYGGDGHAAVPALVTEMSERVHPGDAQGQDDKEKPARRTRGGPPDSAVHRPPSRRQPGR